MQAVEHVSLSSLRSRRALCHCNPCGNQPYEQVGEPDSQKRRAPPSLCDNAIFCCRERKQLNLLLRQIVGEGKPSFKDSGGSEQ